MDLTSEIVLTEQMDRVTHYGCNNFKNNTNYSHFYN